MEINNGTVEVSLCKMIQQASDSFLLSSDSFLQSFFSFLSLFRRSFIFYFVFQFCKCCFRFIRNIAPLENNFLSLLTAKNVFSFSTTLCKMSQLHLISWRGNFAERHSFRIILGDSPETMRKLCLSGKFLHQEIRWNYGIFRSGMNEDWPYVKV